MNIKTGLTLLKYVLRRWFTCIGQRSPAAVVHPAGPPWPSGLGDYDITEAGYTFAELDSMMNMENQGESE